MAEYNIRVQTVLPGPVKSQISKYAYTEDINVVCNKEFKSCRILSKLSQLIKVKIFAKLSWYTGFISKYNHKDDNSVASFKNYT